MGPTREAALLYRFDTRTFDRLFPFHLVIAQDLTIERVGPVLGRAMPELTAGAALLDHFGIRRPSVIEVNFATLSAEPERIYLLAAKSPSELVLKGQMVPLDGRDALIFLGSPWITSLDQLGRFGLTVADFAVHDSMTDFLVLIQAQNAALEDATKLAKQLAEARDAALQASQFKSEFLATMSHELRTPLNAILGFSEALSSALFGPLSDHYRSYANDIHKSGRLLLELINDLLDLSRVEAGQYQLNETTLALPGMLDECIQLVGPEARRKGLSLTLDCAAANLTLRADPRALKQTILNLLSNAVKFTHFGGVTVAVHREPDSLVLTVTDTGIGISPETIGRLFEPFRQANVEIARKYGGSGLGLSICRRMIELHGGTIALASEPGAGTIVTIRLPSARIL
jgi:signal transduction histidine kinase